MQSDSTVEQLLEPREREGITELRETTSIDEVNDLLDEGYQLLGYHTGKVENETIEEAGGYAILFGLLAVREEGKPVKKEEIQTRYILARYEETSS